MATTNRGTQGGTQGGTGPCPPNDIGCPLIQGMKVVHVLSRTPPPPQLNKTFGVSVSQELQEFRQMALGWIIFWQGAFLVAMPFPFKELCAHLPPHIDHITT